ncbi:MAG: C40 family peptidase, partial [Treponema sp.]|nr:C40 family peptidase [Treponema sp.]
MKHLFFAAFFLIAAGLFAAPLEGGFVRAPIASASPAEKEQAYTDARNKVIDAAAKYENVPYRYAGTTRSGLDCSGFIYVSFKDALGVSTPRSSTGLYTWAEIIPLDKAQPGDLLFFKTGSGGTITHVAIYLGSRRFIHSASSGPNTGVIYSTLDEQYWSRAYVAAGRAFPETSGYQPVLASAPSSEKPASSAGDGWGRQTIPPAKTSSASGINRFLFGFALAPTWGFINDSNLMRGVSSQFRFAVDTTLSGVPMIFGFELRTEYDRALGVFRIPFTLSWGYTDKLRIFAGPVLSFGDPSISTAGGERNYSGGSSWLGAIGICAAPFILKSSAGEIAPYFETAWQYYMSDNESKNT